MDFLPRPETIITGCDLVCSVHGTVFHGDLWLYNDMYIFNSVTSHGDALVMERPAQERFIALDLTTRQYFERRGVFVIARQLAKLSEAAVKYLE